MVFKYLDKEQKGYIDYADFCNLSDERRLNLDPAQAMLKEYEETGKILAATGRGQSKSPSRKEKERRASSSCAGDTQKIKAKTELEQYLS